MGDIYNDSTYLKNNPTWYEEDAPFKVGKIMELLNRNTLVFKSVCDIGCGSGELLVQLAGQMKGVKKFVCEDPIRFIGLVYPHQHPPSIEVQ